MATEISYSKEENQKTIRFYEIPEKTWFLGKQQAMERQLYFKPEFNNRLGIYQHPVVRFKDEWLIIDYNMEFTEYEEVDVKIIVKKKA
jgi:hypothetical protein